MKNNFLRVLILLTCFLPPILKAEAPPVVSKEKLIPGLSVKGAFRVRSEEDNHVDLVTLKDYSLLRARFDVFYAVNPMLSLFAEPQFSKTFGERAFTATSASINTAADTSGNTLDTFLGIHQLYASYEPIPQIDFYVGRQVLIYGDELVIGASDWNNVGRSFDAYRFRYNHPFGWADLLFAKVADNNTTSATASTATGDKDLTGVYAHFELPYVDNVDPYFFQKNDRSVTPEIRVNAWGIRVQTKIDWFDLRGEQTTESIGGLTAWQYDAEIGVKAFDVRLSVGLLDATEDYDQLYPSAHKWLGYADVLGRRNIKSQFARLAYSPTPKFSFGAEYNMFTRHVNTSPVYKTDGATSLSVVTPNGSDQVGSELDLSVKGKLNDNLDLVVGASKFFTASYLDDQIAPVDITMYYATFDVKF